jgi:hypothetical protein|eukprot:COSAG02_NODE_99_length_37069_cov_24.910957_35_plen_99_part_00
MLAASAAAGVLALAQVLGSALAEEDVANGTAPAEDAGGDPVDWASVLFFIGALLHLTNFVSATILDTVALKVYIQLKEDEPATKAKDQVCRAAAVASI